MTQYISCSTTGLRRTLKNFLTQRGYNRSLSCSSQIAPKRMQPPLIPTSKSADVCGRDVPVMQRESASKRALEPFLTVKHQEWNEQSQCTPLHPRVHQGGRAELAFGLQQALPCYQLRSLPNADANNTVLAVIAATIALRYPSPNVLATQISCLTQPLCNYSFTHTYHLLLKQTATPQKLIRILDWKDSQPTGFKFELCA